MSLPNHESKEGHAIPSIYKWCHRTPFMPYTSIYTFCLLQKNKWTILYTCPSHIGSYRPRVCGPAPYNIRLHCYASLTLWSCPNSIGCVLDSTILLKYSEGSLAIDPLTSVS